MDITGTANVYNSISYKNNPNNKYFQKLREKLSLNEFYTHFGIYKAIASCRSTDGDKKRKIIKSGRSF